MLVRVAATRSAAGVRRQEGDRVAGDERRLGVARDLVAVERGDDVLVEARPIAAAASPSVAAATSAGSAAGGRVPAQHAEARGR